MEDFSLLLLSYPMTFGQSPLAESMHFPAAAGCGRASDLPFQQDSTSCPAHTVCFSSIPLKEILLFCLWHISKSARKNAEKTFKINIYVIDLLFYLTAHC